MDTKDSGRVTKPVEAESEDARTIIQEGLAEI